MKIEAYGKEGTMEFQEAAIRAAKEEGFCLGGFTKPNPRKEFLRRHEARRRNGKLSPFVPHDGLSALSVEKHWPFCTSILSLAMSYKGRTPVIGAEEGKMSRVALGRDYHLVVSEAVGRMMEKLRGVFPGLEYQFQVDNGPLSDRASAWESGLGFYGRNGFIIHPRFGSFLYLAQVFTNMPVEDSGEPMENQCGSCRRCMDACPTKAIGEDGSLDASRCISYLTQKKGVLHGWERSALGSSIYGCDLCQDVCPFNEKAPDSQAEALLWDGKRDVLNLRFILSMGKDAFRQNFSQRAAGWRGKGILQRNALVVCGNRPWEENRKLLLEHLDSPSETKRIHAMFSLERYGPAERRLVAQTLEKSTPSFQRTFEQHR